MDLLSAGIGAFVGIMATLLMVEIGLKKILPWGETSRLTSIWSLEDIKGTKPLAFVAEDIEGVEIPKGSLVVVKGDKIPYSKDSRIAKNPAVNTNFAVGEDRALIFSGVPRYGTLAVWTTNPKIIARLGSEFNRLWSESRSS
ncbi:MAG: hypothetical protein QME47_01525 [Candidatus Thermoplasmatota archaeon]|nr:hypothetical protein [Candidatus Thermoplasmatota archaeon]